MSRPLAFSPPPLFPGAILPHRTVPTRSATPHTSRLFLAPLPPPPEGGGDYEERKRERDLSSLGFTDAEISRSDFRRRSDSPDEGGTAVPPENVRVDKMDVDPVSITALGFGLIALNFFVLANLGDGGISGLVATMINTFR